MKDFIINNILPTIENPSRYLGNEINSIHKEIDENTIRFAFAFPDTYEVGMSHLGIKILYHLLNDEEDIFCERVFAPWPDMEDKMRENNIPLFTLESMDYVSEFDFLGFTLQYEMSYTNMINMLDLAKIPVLTKDRDESHPFIIVGGPCAYNPEPIADFVDIVVLGEGEEVILEIMDKYRRWDKNSQDRHEFLLSMADIQGVYVPSFYETSYFEDGRIKSFIPKHENFTKKIKKRFIKDLNKVYYPEKIIVPFLQIVHDRIMLEVFRGCVRGCRFCQAGMIYRPVREKSKETILDCAEKLINNTGYEEVSLSSLSTSDYTHLQPLINDLVDKYKDKKVSVSLPSLRIDSFSVKLAQEIQKVRKTGLTFAPEAGTQKLRDVINKGVNEEDLINTTREAFEAGWGHIKLYFMIGLPTEEYVDLDGIADLGDKVLSQYYNIEKVKRNKNVKVVISTSSFVPKAFTPFQWEAQDDMETLRQKQKYLKQKIKNKKITYNWHDPKTSFLESIFARGDRKLNKVLLIAHQKGCKFDGWGEYFDFEKWMDAFKEAGIDPEFYAIRKRNYEEILPWDFIDIGVTKDYLIREHKKALDIKTTEYCREKCTNCGIMNFSEGWKCNDFSKV